jgi:hypothetical protein
MRVTLDCNGKTKLLQVGWEYNKDVSTNVPLNQAKAHIYDKKLFYNVALYLFRKYFNCDGGRVTNFMCDENLLYDEA